MTDYDSDNEIDRDTMLSDAYCHDTEWKNHPDRSLTYEEVLDQVSKYTGDDLQYFRDHVTESQYGPRLINDFIATGLLDHLELVYDVMYSERDSPDYNHDLLYAAKKCPRRDMIERILDLYLNARGHHEHEVKRSVFTSNLKSNSKLTKEDQEAILKQAPGKGEIIEVPDDD